MLACAYIILSVYIDQRIYSSDICLVLAGGSGICWFAATILIGWDFSGCSAGLICTGMQASTSIGVVLCTMFFFLTIMNWLEMR